MGSCFGFNFPEAAAKLGSEEVFNEELESKGPTCHGGIVTL